MKKITSRAVSVLLIAALVIAGMGLYIGRYIFHGEDWALFFSGANSDSTGVIKDRNGVVLASFSPDEKLYADDQLTRLADYHVLGDYWGRTGSGILSRFQSGVYNFNLLTGTTKVSSSKMTLNIDSELNKVAYNALGGRKGAVLLSNYKTGEILSLVSTPVVDPADQNAEVPEGAYINRCLSAAFVPGSVFKLVTAAAAIENIPDLYDRSFYCEGEYDIAGVKIKCSGTHYTQTFEQAMANSCNCAFAQVAVMLGQDTMKKYVQQYGFLDSQKINGIRTARGSYPQDFIGDPELAWSGIGQSTDLISPYSMLRFVSAVANDGILCEPSIVKEDSAPEKTRFMKADTADKLKQLMSYNVSSHYAQRMDFSGLNLCAKTGTAELGNGTSHAWFTGFLDDEAHPYAFVVLVEQGGSGLSAAGSVANSLLQAAVNR